MTWCMGSAIMLGSPFFRGNVSVGAREVRSGWQGLYGRPRPVPCAHLWGNAITPPPPGDHKGLCWRMLQKVQYGRATARDRPYYTRVNRLVRLVYSRGGACPRPGTVALRAA